MAPTAFMHRERQPTEEEILSALGPVASLWKRLTGYVQDAYGVEPTFVPPSRHYGWDVKYRKGGKTLVSLTPDEGRFTALVVLGEKETEAARELVVELAQCTCGVGYGPERCRTALAERACERPLLAGGLLADPARRALNRQRTCIAARDAGDTDRRAEVHQRLGCVGRELHSSPPPDSLDVDVDGEDVLAASEAPDRRSRVRTDPGELGEIVRPAVRGDVVRRAVEVERPSVVAEPLPFADHVRRRGCRERFRRRPALEPALVPGYDALDLRLLEHDLADEDGVRVASASPREVATVIRVPREKPGFHDRDRTRGYEESPMLGAWRGRTLPSEEVREMNLTRTLALCLGAVAAIAIGAQGAAGAPEEMHVKVTGKDNAFQLSVKPLPEVAGVLDRRHEVWSGRQDSSDARVSGRYRAVFDVWEYPDERAHFADMSMLLSNAKGSWRADSFGVNTRDGSHFIRAVAYGQGAYRGLRYVVIVHDKASGSAGTHLFDVDGWIERGEAPAKQPVATDDVHVKVIGTSTPHRVLPVFGDLRAGVEKTSDPRTSGKYSGTMKLRTYPDGRMHFFGKYELKSELGTWKGEWHGIVTVDRRYLEFVDAVGTGELAGLRYRHVNSGRYPKSAPKAIPLSVTGWIESVK